MNILNSLLFTSFKTNFSSCDLKNSAEVLPPDVTQGLVLIIEEIKSQWVPQ